MEDEGNVFELIAEECYYNDKWEKENGRKQIRTCKTRV